MRTILSLHEIWTSRLRSGVLLGLWWTEKSPRWYEQTRADYRLDLQTLSFPWQRLVVVHSQDEVLSVRRSRLLHQATSVATRIPFQVLRSSARLRFEVHVTNVLSEVSDRTGARQWQTSGTDYADIQSDASSADVGEKERRFRTIKTSDCPSEFEVSLIVTMSLVQTVNNDVSILALQRRWRRYLTFVNYHLMRGRWSLIWFELVMSVIPMAYASARDGETIRQVDVQFVLLSLR